MPRLRGQRWSWSATSRRKARSQVRASSSTWSTPLYFEGEGGHHRILRAVKNRFGPTDEIGVFEMSDKGLREVSNPSELFLCERHAKAPGAAVFAGMEGTRPVLVEVQALVAPSPLGTPRRAVVGWSWPTVIGALPFSWHLADCDSAPRNLSQRRGRVPHLGAGCRPRSRRGAGFIPCRPCLPAIASIRRNHLSRRVRPVAHSQQRLKEAEKLGFGQAVLPLGGEEPAGAMDRMFQPSTLTDLVVRIAGTRRSRVEQND